MISSNLSLIASFSFPHEAHLAKANLEAAEIVAFITDEHTVNINWLYSDAIGGVKLYVLKGSECEAKNILKTDFSENLEAEISVDKNLCKFCKSDNLSPYTKGKKPAFLVFLLLGFPLFFYKHGYVCNNCGKFNKS